MAPPSATTTETPESVQPQTGMKVDAPTTNPGHPGVKMAGKMALPGVPTFEDKYQEREYQKGRLALAFRIFAKLGYDEGVAGHITLRVQKTIEKI